MDQNFQTSFIPKRPLAEDRTERPKTVSVFLFIASIILIASIVGAGFVYFYSTSLTNQVTQMRSDLGKAAGAFEGDFIQQLQVMDRRINAAGAVLSDHIVVSPIFNALQQSTLKTVQYTKFSYTISGTGPSAQVNIQMGGRAQSYTAVALQSDSLAQNKYIKDPVFSNLTLDDKGNVLFDLTFSVDPKLVLYGESLARASGTSTTDNSSSIQAPQSSGTSTGATGGVVSFPTSTGTGQ